MALQVTLQNEEVMARTETYRMRQTLIRTFDGPNTHRTARCPRKTPESVKETGEVAGRGPKLRDLSYRGRQMQ